MALLPYGRYVRGADFHELPQFLKSVIFSSRSLFYVLRFVGILRGSTTWNLCQMYVGTSYSNLPFQFKKAFSSFFIFFFIQFFLPSIKVHWQISLFLWSVITCAKVVSYLFHQKPTPPLFLIVHGQSQNCSRFLELSWTYSQSDSHKKLWPLTG